MIARAALWAPPVLQLIADFVFYFIAAEVIFENRIK